MKKHILVTTGILCMVTAPAISALTQTVAQCYNPTTQVYSVPYLASGVTPSSSCLSACGMTAGTSPTTSTSNGIITTTQPAVKVTSSTNAVPTSDASLVSCTRTSTKTYVCEAGYYGSPTSSTSGCTQCEKGYYCPGGTTRYSCATQTKNSSATSAAGAKSITSCYLPANTSFSDSSGTYQYSSNCYYSN